MVLSRGDTLSGSLKIKWRRPTLIVMIWLIVLRFLLISLSNRGAHLIISVYLI